MIPQRLKLLLCGLSLIMASQACKAQDDPRALPGDRPPGTLSSMLRPPSGRPLPPPNTTAAIPSALALQAVSAALAACEAQGVRLSVAVIDSAGQLRAAGSSDEAEPGVYAAVRKGLTAIAFREPSSAVQAKVRVDPAIASQIAPNMELHPGAVPVIKSQRLMGAIGASGGTAQQDEACAEAGLEKIEDQLR